MTKGSRRSANFLRATFRRWRRHAGQSGFTLIEMLIATMLTGIIFAALATVTAQWMPNWNRGMAGLQQIDRLSAGLDRVASDIAAAEFVPLNGAVRGPMFVGEALSVTFVRTAIGPNARPGLEFVRLAERADQQGLALVRERADFKPSAAGESIAFGDRVVLVRSPYRISFSYAGHDQVWQPVWRDALDLPAEVRISVRDAVSDRILPVSPVVAIQVEARADCVGAKNVSQCLAGGGNTSPENIPATGTAPTQGRN